MFRYLCLAGFLALLTISALYIISIVVSGESHITSDPERLLKHINFVVSAVWLLVMVIGIKIFFG